MGTSVRHSTLSLSLFLSSWKIQIFFLQRRTRPVIVKSSIAYVRGMALTVSLQVGPIPFLPLNLYYLLTIDSSPDTAPSHHSTVTTGLTTVQKQVKKSDTSLTTTSLLLSSTAASCPVSTFGPPSIVLRVFRPVSTVGMRPVRVP